MKLIKILIFLLISFNLPLKTYSNTNIENILKDGEKLIFVRHAYAPGGGDPSNFDITDCSTQRNLNEEGIVQSVNLGNFFTKNQCLKAGVPVWRDGHCDQNGTIVNISKNEIINLCSNFPIYKNLNK